MTKAIRPNRRAHVYAQIGELLDMADDAKNMPRMIKETIRVEAWRERPDALGNPLPASDIHHFVHGEPPHGLGTTCEAIESLIKHDPEAMRMWAEATGRMFLVDEELTSSPP